MAEQDTELSTIPPKDEVPKQMIPLNSPTKAQDILAAISQGTPVELDVDKEVLLGNFNAFMLSEAYSQLPTIIKLHELQTKCLDKYYELVNEMLDNDDVNVFLLDKLITTINNNIDRCNSIILRLGLNEDVSSGLVIKHIENSQNIVQNVYQSQLSKQKVIETVNNLMSMLGHNNKEQQHSDAIIEQDDIPTTDEIIDLMEYSEGE